MKRVQRKRTKGWKKPINAVYVGRGTKWGNPFKVEGTFSNEDAVKAYVIYLGLNKGLALIIKKELKGKDLMCFCPLDKPCHADVLLKLANQ